MKTKLIVNPNADLGRLPGAQASDLRYLVEQYGGQIGRGRGILPMRLSWPARRWKMDMSW